jgi:hypothetical protein
MFAGALLIGCGGEPTTTPVKDSPHAEEVTKNMENFMKNAPKTQSNQPPRVQTK